MNYHYYYRGELGQLICYTKIEIAGSSKIEIAGYNNIFNYYNQKNAKTDNTNES